MIKPYFSSNTYFLSNLIFGKSIKSERNEKSAHTFANEKK